MQLKKFLVEEPKPRLDAFLSESLPELSRNKARELCDAEKVLVNGKTARSGTPLEAGDTVEVIDFQGAVQARPDAVGNEMPAGFAVLYEDEHMLVVSKPRKLASVRLRHEDTVTLADCVASCSALCLQASPDPREAGLVQRLDYYTSGVVLAAKSRAAWESIRKQLFAEKVEKTYLALVDHNPVKPRFTVNLPLAQSRDGKTMTVVKEKNPGEPVQLSAVTEVTVVGKFEHGAKWYAVVRAKGRRVRRHQIRVHLSASGHPLSGDTQYGAESTLNDALPWSSGDEEGFLLHAQDIRLQHPVSGKELHFQCSSDYFRRLSKMF